MQRMQLSRRAASAALLAFIVSTGLFIGAGTKASGSPLRVRARAAAHYLTGFGDDNVKMFKSTYWSRLHTKVVRYVAPYDAVTHRASLNRAIAFIQAAEVAHQQVLVAFYHSERTPTTLPSVALYEHDVQRFVKRFPHVAQYVSWDEANRGDVAHLFSSPSAGAAARYYQALIRVCHSCTVVGLDILDGQYLRPALSYITAFKREIGHLETIMPHVWGLHDYVDLNHFEDWRTRDIASAFGGTVWLTETGGIVKFAGAFSNKHGSGLRRAAKVLQYMFSVAGAIPEIKRLYVYNWTGASAGARWDSGVTNVHLQPRPGWLVVCHELHARGCAARISSS